ncbi:hypothetical protein [Actinoplanes siamensis]|uniref:Uncharacterized protein n=1 Tax=Actinoplanes siamensis TaxID=1223317 RepID=A0A919NCK4_9ACTN|nr:hypothetical protein [Actinoplanes siamensis]GIF08668.1 hypothetical protein Asi03nite_62060 [Actinoplanes siamensis]
MSSPAELAAEHARTRRRLAVAVADEARRAWRAVDPTRIAESWIAQMARLLVLVTGAQRAVAGRADQYLTDALVAQGLDPEPAAELVPQALSGVASDGRPLDSLLYRPVVTALTGLQRGAPLDRALAGGQAALDMIVRTQISDAGRIADQVAMTARPGATGYVRMLVGRSCSRCAILAGRWYASNAGFDRHPRCRPGATASTFPDVRAPSATSAPTRRSSSPRCRDRSRTAYLPGPALRRSGSELTSARSSTRAAARSA